MRLSFGGSQREQAALELLETAGVRTVGPQLILGKIFDQIGFNQLPDELFKDIVLARLVYPTSKLRTTEYLLQHHGKNVDVERIYRFLDKLHANYKSQVEQISYCYTRKILGELTVVFYDMTTLYFEAEREDDLRKIGFSKDGKFDKPQIMLGLLVGKDGYPVSYDIFEGNTFEGKTLMPILEKAQQQYGFSKPTVVADSALLSKQNIAELIKKKYDFILGARIKSESANVKDQILQAASKLKDKQSTVIEKPGNLRLIVNYSAKRAKKDASNRDKGLARLNNRLKTGKLTKQHINNRGYNKFLVLDGAITVDIDLDKVEKDKKWDGLKGYVTNSYCSPDKIIDNYRQLWKIEKAFRISKTDLRIRPIYHRKKKRIEAHICIAFVAYTVFKELERLLASNQINMSPQRAIELMKTIYKVTVFLPDSKKFHSSFTTLNENQRKLLQIVGLG